MVAPSPTELVAATAWVPQAALACAADGTIVAANDLAALVLDAQPVGATVEALLPGDVRAAAWRTEVRRSDDVPRLVEVVGSAPDEHGQRLLLLREPAPAAVLSEVQHALDVAFAVAPIGMALFDVDGRYVRVNDALCALLEADADELLGTRDQERTHPDDREADVAAAWRILRGELDAWQTEKRFVRPDGSTVWVIANMTFLRTQEGLPLMWLGQFQDITARKAMEGDLRREADEDALTGLPNRRRIVAELGRELARGRRTGTGGAVLLLDLDGFKQINDTHGHAAGDAALRRVAGALRSRLRAHDLVGRLGGDEFAVLLPGATAEQATTVAGHLDDAVRALGRDGPVPLVASVGVAAFGVPGAPPDAEAVLCAADDAMYRAKAAGRGARA